VQQELERLRVVMVTGAAEAQLRTRCQQRGALAVFDKPEDFPGYLHLARRLVGMARAPASPPPPAPGGAGDPAGPPATPP